MDKGKGTVRPGMVVAVVPRPSSAVRTPVHTPKKTETPSTGKGSRPGSALTTPSGTTPAAGISAASAPATPSTAPVAVVLGTTPGAVAQGAKADTRKNVDAKVAARNSALNAIGGVKVDVFVRVRPFLPMESGNRACVNIEDESTISCTDAMDRLNSFAFDRIYGMEASQQDLFQDAVAPVVEQVSRGMACAIFAYGQTGAGKTYTMQGDRLGDPAHAGIVQRSIDMLFQLFHEKRYTHVNLKCTFLEIYNEELEDLLAERGPRDLSAPRRPNLSKPRLQLVDDNDRGTICQGLTEVEISDSATLLKVLTEAEARCHYTETKLNKMSNRAHRVFTILVQFRRAELDVKTSLTLVDLAGSEDIARSGAKGMTAREASHINKSLLTLGRVINALALNEKHIPYRDSKLTRLLSEALGGVCKTSFIACISPADSSRIETASTLRYAQRAMEALNIDQLPRWKQDEIVIDSLTRRVRQLEDDLLRQAAANRKEMNSLISQRDAAKKESRHLSRTLNRTNKVTAALFQRKARLKSGLGVAISQRTKLEQEKEQLRKELLETRRARDGYLADRDAMSAVLASVRTLRERLLAAHRHTESSLTADAGALKQTVGAALQELDSLYEIVKTKKALALANEQSADAFRTAMNQRLQKLSTSLSQLKGDQEGHIKSVLATVEHMRQLKEEQSSSLTRDVERMCQAAVGVYKDVQERSATFTTSFQQKNGQQRDDLSRHHEELHQSLEKFKLTVQQTMTELRVHSKTLDTNMERWAKLVETRLTDAASVHKTATTHLLKDLTALQDAVASASTSQLSTLDAHNQGLKTYLTTEKSLLQSSTTKLVNDLNAHAQKLLADFLSQTVNRTEAAVSGFVQSTETLAADIRHQASARKDSIQDISKKTSDVHRELETHGETTVTQSRASHTECVTVLNQVTTESTRCDSIVLERVTITSQSLEDYSKRFGTSSRQLDVLAQDANAASSSALIQGTQETTRHSNQLQSSVAHNKQVFLESTDKLEGLLGATTNDLQKNASSHQLQIGDAGESVTVYVNTDLKRDKDPLPVKRTFEYPQQFAATHPYAAILSDVPREHEREDKINRGVIKPGKPVDFPGVLGPEDTSGILQATLSAPLPPLDQATLDEAAAQSDSESYVCEVDPDEPSSEEELEDPMEDEEDILTFNPHDLGEEFDAFRSGDASNPGQAQEGGDTLFF
eukprot:m.436557 g.436557  ORF g.436557 m.436557 type:complete len:1199 (-) comp56774_c0_seq1:270-3866(-)